VGTTILKLDRDQKLLNAIILLKLRHEWHTAISVWAGRNRRRGIWFRLFWRKQNRRRNLKNREHWLVSVWTLWTNGFSLLPFCAKFELYFSWFKCEMYIITARMAEILMLKSNYNLCQSRVLIWCQGIWVFSFPLLNPASDAAVMMAL